jgi:hypothetical protein
LLSVNRKPRDAAFAAESQAASFDSWLLWGYRPTINILAMSLAEIEKAVDALSPEELAKLAAYVARQDKLAWDEQIDQDFSPGGKHAAALEKIDAEIDAGNFKPLP